MNKKNVATPKYDVAIIGGGVAGLYCAWKLALKGKHVAVFERSKRWGGRIETKPMGSGAFNAEFGPMRFEKVGQKNLMTLLTRLGIETAPFPQYQSAPIDWPQYEVTDPEEKRWPNPLDLLLMGILKALGRYRDGMDKTHMLEQVEKLKEEDQYLELRKTARFRGETDGLLLHTRGFWNVLSDVLSHQAVLKIRDTGNFYHVIEENPNAIEWIIFWLRAFQPDDGLVGIRGGSVKLVDGLMEQLKQGEFISKPSLCNGHTLVSLKATKSNVLLEFLAGGRSVNICADHVILALPKRPLESLASSFPESVRRHLNEVRGIPLLKCFFVVKAPWWNEDTPPHTHAGTMPAREVHYHLQEVGRLPEERRPELTNMEVTVELRKYFKNRHLDLPVDVRVCRKDPPHLGWLICPKESRHNPLYFIRSGDLSVFDRRGKGMVMVYTDRPATEYWNPYVQRPKEHDSAEIRESPGLTRRFIKYLSARAGASFPKEMTPEEIEENLLERVEDFGIHDWGCDPYGGAFHIWRPGAQSWKVIGALKAFDINGGSGKRLHICGEAFSDYQGFVEGSLRSAELALTQVLKTRVSFAVVPK